MTTVWWILVVVLLLTGVAGTVLPALPGVVFVLGGVVLAAWIDDFQRISGATVGLCTALAVVALLIDYVATLVFAKRANATRLGLAGAAIGTVAGIFTGLVGLVFMPLIGAAVGEFIAHRDALRAGRVGLATWVGLLVASALKLALVFAMIGVLILALVF